MASSYPFLIIIDHDSDRIRNLMAPLPKSKRISSRKYFPDSLIGIIRLYAMRTEFFGKHLTLAPIEDLHPKKILAMGFSLRLQVINAVCQDLELAPGMLERPAAMI